MRNFVLFCLLSLIAPGAPWARSQESAPSQPPRIDQGSGIGEPTDSLSASERNEVPSSSAEDSVAAPRREQKKFSLLWLLGQGGGLMYVLGAVCVAAVAIVIERAMALRGGRIIPPGLVERLGDLQEQRRPLDPRETYRACQEFPSPAAQVIRTMLVKVGRPQSEIEYSVSEACQREADYLLSGVNTLNLIATVAPLIGLLGTVWGMIHAFYVTTQLEPGQNKAVFLAEGIYTALVTTLGGLVIAIPAAMFAHLFESRIVKEFHRLEELLGNLLPQMERFEGRQRMTRATLDGNGTDVPAVDSRTAR